MNVHMWIIFKLKTKLLNMLTLTKSKIIKQINVLIQLITKKIMTMS
jgi:hypothetical protein